VTDPDTDRTDPEAAASDDAAAPPADGSLEDEAHAAAEAAEADPEADGTADAEQVEGDGDLAAAQRLADERLADLQRVQAEYLNYKRRVDRDRELVKENATYAALAPIVDVLDTIDRAREHGEVEGGFKSVADQLERVVSGLGLVRFGAQGEAFDPNLHEALAHQGTDADVEVTTVQVVVKAGYKIGDRVVRAAQVLVVDPE
jgi:molecular chaperone GrpE